MRREIGMEGQREGGREDGGRGQREVMVHVPITSSDHFLLISPYITPFPPPLLPLSSCAGLAGGVAL